MQPWGSTNAQGLDVSHWQGYVNWAKVRAADYSFAFLKLTEGTEYTDTYFSQNHAGARQNDLLVGAYHFLKAGTASGGASEAVAFLSAVGRYEVDLPHVLDIEAAGTTVEAALAWLQKVEQETGKEPLVYTYPSFIESTLGKSLVNWKLWYAFYNPSSVTPDDNGWTEWEFLQHTEKGTVPGIRGTVDLNVFRGSEGDLHAAYGTPALAAWVCDTIVATWLEDSWYATQDQKQRDYIHWLADEMRRAASILPKFSGWRFRADVANSIIKSWLVPAWHDANDKGQTKAVNNIGWLADQLRAASGQPKQNGELQWIS